MMKIIIKIIHIIKFFNCKGIIIFTIIIKYSVINYIHIFIIKLNCKFIRVNDFNSNSKNVGIVLKEILQDIHMANIILREEIDKEVA